MRILFIPLEFSTWEDASHFPYTENYGFEEGFEASGVEYATLPAFFGTTPADPHSWLHHARRIFEGERFDQVWMEIVHSTYDATFLDWVKTVAPVRIGFIWESCEMDPQESTSNPEGVRRRRSNLERNLPAMTHVVAVDEKDVESFHAGGKVRAKWIWDAGIVPMRYISEDPATGNFDKALIFGELYGDRKALLSHPDLIDRLIRPDASAEHSTPLPRLFDDLHASVLCRLAREGVGVAKELLPEYLGVARTIRKKTFSLWLSSLKAGLAVVNLPQFGHAYASRVVEGMAAGRPVVTWEIPDRPRTRALFRDGEEILLYPTDDPAALAAHLRRLRDEPGLAERIARNAMRKIREEHTTELLVKQILAWVDEEDKPYRAKWENRVRCPAPPSHSSRFPGAGATIASLIAPGDLVFDVGANLGAKADRFLPLGAKLVCIEPQSKMVDALRDKFRGTGAVTVVGKALSDSPSVLTMSICDDAPTISTFSEEWMHGRFSEYRWDRKERVDATTLDLLVQEFGVPKYCKIDVEGFELQVLKGLTKPIPILSFEFTQEFFSNARRCIEYLSDLGYRDFNFSLAESETFSLSGWAEAEEVIGALEKIEDPLLWGDIYARFQPGSKGLSASVTDAPPTEFSSDAFLREATERGLWRKGEPLRLHLGCGENRMDGYINVDYPPSEHNVMRTVADVQADIAKLSLPDRSVDEIRLHHVFEHFNRVSALALLIRWHGWLKVGGKLVIETPDIVGSAKTLISDVPLDVKMGVVRHLAGDQAAAWAYHVDHWFPERFEHTLSALGFDRVVVSASSWPMPPYLSNVEVTARKDRTMRMVDQLAAADRLLWESTVAPAEKPTWEIWRRQLRAALQGEENTETVLPTDSPAGLQVKGILPEPSDRASRLPLAEIHDFNQLERDRWVSEQARKIPAGARVLDVGAGTCPYRRLFAHCDYRTHDFMKYGGVKLGGTAEYGNIDYVSEIDAIPVPENSFDVVLCTEVLEHVPEPIRALEEMARILKPGGKLLLTAPLGSGLHQLPFHFYGGYTPGWYRHFGPMFGLDVTDIRPNGGFFRLLAQECARVAWTFPQHARLHGGEAETVRTLFGETLPRYLFSLEDRCMIDQFTVGYHVEMVRSPVSDVVVPSTPKEEPPGIAVSGKEVPPGEWGGPAIPRVTTVVFSKDRPLQLDATLRSLFRYCRDVSLLNIHVLYKASTSSMEIHYATLRMDYATVDFIPEKDFKEDLLALAGSAEKILFLVDDNLFVHGFEVSPAIRILDQRSDVLGLSLRLGRNTTYCYPLDTAQSLPDFRSLGDGILAYPWKGASHDFGYPLEVSSSVYRGSDLLPLLKVLGYHNPNTLESVLHDSRFSFSGCRPLLLTFERSVTFCAPVNRVQDEMKNRVGGCAEYTPESLAGLYGRGYRLDPDAYEGLIPEACHKEVKLQFRAPQGAEPLVSVVIPCYNQANFLPMAVESVVAQTYGNWEIVIVNDGSPDNTSDVSRKLIAKHRGKRIRLIEKTNGGLAHARNTGIREAAGEYVLPLDSDDMIHPEMISKTVRVLEIDRTVSIAHTDTYMFGTVKQLVQKRPFDFPAICKENFMNYCSLYRKKVWEDVGGYNQNMEYGYEDWDFWIGCGEKSHIATHVPEPLFFYRIKEESMLTKALEHDRELRAQIVLNHPSLYGRDEWVKAKALLEGIRAEQDLRDGMVEGGAKLKADSTPIVSVIVPTYNRPGMLRGTLKSILDQTYRNFEIVVVNDGGEGVEDVVASMNGDMRITYVRHDRNRGLAAARNTGIRLARGKYIAYLDDDDLYYPDHLDTLVTHLEKHGGKVAYTDARRAIQKMTDGGYVTIRRESPSSRDFNRDQFLVTNYVAVLCFMHEKACLEETGYFDETLTSHEDWDLWIRMSQKYDFVHIRKFTCEFSWRTDGTTMTSGIRSDYIRTMEIIHNKYRDITRGKPHLLDMQKKSLDVLKAEVCGTDNNTSVVVAGKQDVVDATVFHVEPISTGRRPSTLDNRISVIIPVKNAGENIRGLLGKIRSQKKVREVEIIIIDSGSTDGTVAIAEGFGCRVIRIPEREFNHGTTRNLGAREARGEYLVFTVQDALPTSDYWLYAMVSPFVAYPEIAALSSKQFVRPEADLFSLWMNEAMYQSIGFVEDSIFTLSPSFDYANWKHLDSQIRRQMSFFDNVSSCVRRSVFDEIRFNALINAEDMDFGVSLLEKRKKIGFLTTAGVYHWHERGPEYVLKRHFIGTKATLYIMKNGLHYFFNEHRVDWHSLAANIVSLYDLVAVAIPEADSSGPRLLDVATAFVSSMSRHMHASPEEISKALSAKAQTDGEGFKPWLLDLFGDAVPVPDEHADYKKNFLLSGFMENIGHLVDFLSTRQFSSAEREKDLISCIYKTLAVTVGEALGSYYLEAETLDHLTDDLKRMDHALAKGVCYY